MKFHENLKRICTEKGTTPTAVLKQMGVATSKVAAWNKGSLPKEEMMVNLARHLNCSVMDFFWDESDEAILASAEKKCECMKEQPEEHDDEDEKDVLALYRSLSRREKHEFMAMIYDFEKRVELTGDNGSTSSTVG